MMNPSLLIIFAAPALEETLVDWLLENEKISGFSTMQGFGHGSSPSSLSIREQVAGRQRRVQFMIKADEAALQHLLQDMRERFAGTGLNYMLMPLIDAGRI